MTTYTDADGRRYREVTRVPYSELQPGNVYADPDTGDVGVFSHVRRGEGCEPFVKRILAVFAHRMVILLEPVLDGDQAEG